MDKRMLTLEAEAASAASLARTGLTLLRNMGSQGDADPVLVCLSTAAEKMLKLTIGLAALEQHGEWPSKAEMQAFSHNILKLNSQAMSEIATRIDDAVHAPVVWQAVKDSLDIAWTEPLLTALANYGGGGRFYNLDSLAGAQQPHPSPPLLWWDMEIGILGHRPEVLETPPVPHASMAEARRPLNAHTAKGFSSWWDSYFLAWRHGVIGEDARALSTTIKLHAQQPATD
jgi:hypothetical protein